MLWLQQSSLSWYQLAVLAFFLCPCNQHLRKETWSRQDFPGLAVSEFQPMVAVLRELGHIMLHWEHVADRTQEEASPINAEKEHFLLSLPNL